MNKIENIKNNSTFKANATKIVANSAINKLGEFQSTIEKSDFRNSYSRYSIEYKLLKDAIDEAEKCNNSELVAKFKQEKSKIEDIILLTFNVKMKD